MDNKDLDELLAEINNPSIIPDKKKKQKPRKQTKDVKDNDEIVKTLNNIKIDNNQEITLTSEEPVIVQTTDTIETEAEKAKKKKKKRPKKKTENKDEETNSDDERNKEKEEKLKYYKSWFNFDLTNLTETRYQDNSVFRVLKDWKETPWKQTNPPTRTIEEQFPNEDYPVGELMEYENGKWRTTSQEKKEQERLMIYDIKSLRKAAECQRQVRRYAQSIIRPGERLIDICTKLEHMNRMLINQYDLSASIAFPTGCSINHCAAHYTPNPGDLRTLGKDDVCKIDFGTQVNGLIIDTAFTVAFNPMFDDLLLAVQDATDTGLKEAGIDVRLGDIGAAIQEVMESYEVVINGKTYPVKSVKNLCGHSIEPYKIHAGKSVPIVKRHDNTKMEEGELFAIETFGSTGKGYIYEDKDCSHFMKDFYAGPAKPKNEKARALLSHINKKFGTLAFCRRWLEEDGFPQHSLALKNLVDQGIINPYPPLSDIEGCYVAQFEHTVLLKPTGKEVLSRGDDY